MSLNEQLKKGTADIEQITGIQFGILSPEKILAESGVHVYKHITKGNEQQNTLSDPRLGSTRSTKNAITQLPSKIDPGNFGHCILALPVYHPIFFDKCVKLLKCICHTCSSLKIKTPGLVNTLTKLPMQHRLNYYQEYKDPSVKKKSTACAACGGDLYDVQKKKDGIFPNIVLLMRTGKSSEIINLNQQQVHDIFKKITDEDSELLGFHPKFARPEWMIITVLPIAPLNMRPSVVSEDDKVSEDDITMALHNILKHNKAIVDAKNDTDRIKLWPSLQWHVATLIDNETSAYTAQCNRAHRPLKTIKGRHKGKPGRIRNNLMGKRTNHSSRSVITADPNLSIDQVGVPEDIARVLTYPEIVTERNLDRLTNLVHRGPRRYPGANAIKKANQEFPTDLSIQNEEELQRIRLDIGTIVYRHMVDGDICLFNRQPSLHKMSMMGHYAVILPGRSYRIQVNVTTPYNADFDGDEMNLHLPQSEVARREWEALALTPTQICSPQANKPIISAVQDTLLAAYRCSSEHVRGYGLTERDYLNPKDFMHLVNWITDYRGVMPELSSSSNGNVGWVMRHVFNMFLPPITISGKCSVQNGQFELKERQTDEGKIEPISKENGLLSEQAGSLLHVAFNDLGHHAAKDIIDNFSRLMSQWMIINGFSVGLYDITNISDNNMAAIEAKSRASKQKVNHLIDALHKGTYKTDRLQILDPVHHPRGLFDNEHRQFEQDVYSELAACKKAIEKMTVKAIKTDKLDRVYDNRLMSMIDSGSKGKDTNVNQIISLLAQQDIDGGRFPDYFRRRPLQFVPKDDLSTESRGFISNSFSSGLNFTEYIFHAAAGRLGIISTSIKTAETGYLERKLIKRLEDVSTYYDSTIRANNNFILQYVYGGDSYDGSKIEKQQVDHITYSAAELKARYYFTPDDWENLVRLGDYGLDSPENHIAVQREFQQLQEDWTFQREKYKSTDIPSEFPSVVNIDRVIKSIQLRLKSAGTIQRYVSAEEVLSPAMITAGVNQLISELTLPTSRYISQYSMRNFYILLRSKLASKVLLFEAGYSRVAFDALLKEISRIFYLGVVQPGEAVGAIAAQSIGEPSTQMTLDAFHSTGAKATVSGGVPRFKEILSLTKLKRPSVTIYLKVRPNEHFTDLIPMPVELMQRIHLSYPDIPPTFDGVNAYLTLCDSKEEKDAVLQLFKKIAIEPIKNSFAYLVFETTVLHSEITYGLFGGDKIAWHIKYAIDEYYRDKIDAMSAKIEARFKLPVFIDRANRHMYVEFTDTHMASQKPPMEYLPMIDADILNTHIEGITDIEKAEIRLIKRDIRTAEGQIICRTHPDYEKWCNRTLDSDDFVIDTIGSNMTDILSMDYVDPTRTFTNDIHEMNEIYGIEVARRTISYETMEVLNASATVDVRHVDLLADTMTCYGLLQKIDRSGAKTTESGPLHLASFEETTTNICNAAAFSQVDNMKGVSANIMHGQNIKVGTGAFELLFDDGLVEEFAKDTYVKPTEINIIQGTCGTTFKHTIDDDRLNFSYVL
jgi:DNA-directed RNA polymerase II subunit RPB1